MVTYLADLDRWPDPIVRRYGKNLLDQLTVDGHRWINHVDISMRKDTWTFDPFGSDVEIATISDQMASPKWSGASHWT
jgi:hypothetical protein